MQQILSIPPEEGNLGIILGLNYIQLKERTIDFRPEDYLVLKKGYRMIFTTEGIFMEKAQE